ncbi:hypothetical protein CDAR_27371 [Caerostris darwini]|uniref:Maturase K n=1 Tax=Caerostris darwini TaxID=1538125 RepID=A0AAV4RC94_9ARAC|nr:hypothetical protein CDAR_27371 [Caerostris darwini]
MPGSSLAFIFPEKFSSWVPGVSPHLSFPSWPSKSYHFTEECEVDRWIHRYIYTQNPAWFFTVDCFSLCALSIDWATRFRDSRSGIGCSLQLKKIFLSFSQIWHSFFQRTSRPRSLVYRPIYHFEAGRVNHTISPKNARWIDGYIDISIRKILHGFSQWTASLFVPFLSIGHQDFETAARKSAVLCSSKDISAAFSERDIYSCFAIYSRCVIMLWG